MSLSDPHPPSSDSGAGQTPGAVRSLISILRRRALIIVLTTLLVGGATAAFAYLSNRAYQTTAELLFSQTIGTELNALGLIPPTTNTDRLAADNQAFVASRRVAARTALTLHDGTSVDSIQSHVSVPLPKTSDVVQVVASSTSPQRAARLANAYAVAVIQLARSDQSVRTQGIVRGLTGALNRLKSRDPTTIGIKAKIAQVSALGASGTGVPQLIQAGFSPTSKSGKPLGTVLLGVLFGLMLGVGLALLREQTDRRLRHAEEVSVALDTPVLATIPRDRALARRASFASLRPGTSEPFLMLQANLRYGYVEPVRSVLITSSREGQGKSTIAWNLASAAAASGLSVVLVDADLRRSSLASRYKLAPFPGLAEVLRGAVSANSAVQSVPLEPESEHQNGHGSANGHVPALNVLVAGATPPDPAALLQSTWMRELLTSLRRDHDLVIVDTPPVAQVSDAIGLLRLVEGVLVAVSINSTSGPEAERLRVQLQALDARVLGAVATGGRSSAGYVYPRARTSAAGAGTLA